MYSVKYPIDFNLHELVRNELPMTYTMYENKNQIFKDVEELFEYPNTHKKAMPFYVMSPSEADKSYDTFNKVYNMLLHTLQILFNEDIEIVKDFFGREFLTKHSTFFEFAKYTFNAKQPALYGRFDACMNPDTGNIEGIYEFNGDTPVMLFESVVLQNIFSTHVTGSNENQFNNFYHTLQGFVKNLYPKYNFGVICNTDYIEDSVTSETFAQIFNEKKEAQFSDIENFEFDFTIKDRTPFTLDGISVSDIFILHPWEEMLEIQPDFFKNWETWKDKVKFYEPAWRWFLANKGIWAYVTYLMDSNSTFNDLYKDLPILKSYLSPDIFIEKGQSYVAKPLIGRLSMNIQIFKDGSKDVSYESEGGYHGTQCIYQEFKEPYKVEGRNKFIACCWMAPLLSEYDTTNSVRSEAATMCFREFDTEVLSISNERFIPHLVL